MNSCQYGDAPYALKDKTEGFSFSPLAKSKVGNMAVVGVRVSRKDKIDINLFFDKNSFLLVKSEQGKLPSKNNPNRRIVGLKVGPSLPLLGGKYVEKLFSEFKELIPGLKVPTKILVREVFPELEERKWEMEITEMCAVGRHDASVFARPD